VARSTKLASGVAMIVLTAMARPSFPDSVPLPDDFAPEGIAIGTGTTFYAGSLIDGDIYRGDLRSGQGSIFIDFADDEERAAAGLKVDESHRRLFVAGGSSGRGFVYDTGDGATLANVEFGQPGSTLINDVVVTKGGAYFTDSNNPVLYKIPIAPDGTLGPPEAITVTGPAAAIVGFPNLNGIDATANGDTLIVAHSTLGALFTIDPQTGASRPIPLTGGTLTPGTPDGILLDGRSLWVVENFANRLVEVRLSPDLSRGHITSVLTNADVGGLFRVPTTVADHGHRLALVNARFDLGLPPPFGPGAPPGTDYDVAVVTKP
jgi:sugar lactone lactonase YvrE